MTAGESIPPRIKPFLPKPKVPDFGHGVLVIMRISDLPGLERRYQVIVADGHLCRSFSSKSDTDWDSALASATRQWRNAKGGRRGLH